jgi:hypothetical protein
MQLFYLIVQEKLYLKRSSDKTRSVLLAEYLVRQSSSSFFQKCKILLYCHVLNVLSVLVTAFANNFVLLPLVPFMALQDEEEYYEEEEESATPASAHEKKLSHERIALKLSRDSTGPFFFFF